MYSWYSLLQPWWFLFLYSWEMLYFEGNCRVFAFWKITLNRTKHHHLEVILNHQFKHKLKQRENFKTLSIVLKVNFSWDIVFLLKFLCTLQSHFSFPKMFQDIYCKELTSLETVVFEQPIIRIAICHKPESRILHSQVIILSRNMKNKFEGSENLNR